MRSFLERVRQVLASFAYTSLRWILGLVVFLVSVRLLLDTFNFDTNDAIFTALCIAVIVVGAASLPFQAISNRRFHERFTTAMEQPQSPVSLETNQPTPITHYWGSVLAVPQAAVALNADNSALQLTSFDLAYNVLLPTAMISQVEFDRGDGPPKARYPGFLQRRNWLGMPFHPTVYLGVRCADDGEVFVYPLCFHPDHETDALVLYDRLNEGHLLTRTVISFPAKINVLENSLPGSFSSKFLRTDILRLFWPDYQASRYREWLNK